MVLLTRGSKISFAGTLLAKAYSRTLSTISNQYPGHIGSGQYQEGDRVLAWYKDAGKVKHKLLQPLKAGRTTRTPYTNYELNHSDIIGKPAGRLYVSPTHTTTEEKHRATWRITQPIFDDFVSLAPRSVTPIYASYAARMVDLLDLHVSPPQSSNDPGTSEVPPLEILEAGTGHGSLTIHLSRVIAAANPPPPITKHLKEDNDVEEAWNEWRKSRRAVIHTVEYDKSRSKETAGLIQSFRGGMYWPHVNFHSGDVGEWVKQEQETRRKHTTFIDNATDKAAEFLDIVILDLPGVHEKLSSVIHAMKEDAQLLVYVPQISQLIACQLEIDRQQHPLLLDRVLELGEGISNGRVWDLRFVKTRAEQKPVQASPTSERMDESLAQEASLSNPPTSNPNAESAASDVDKTDFPTMICRPMVGKLTMGGAFVALWRKKAKFVLPEQQ